MLSVHSLMPKLPTKPTKQPLFGPRHFVVGTGDFFTPPIIKGSSPVQLSIRPNVVQDISKEASVTQLGSPRGPQEAITSAYVPEDSSTADESSMLEEEEEEDCIVPTAFQDPDLNVNYSEDLDFLAEKLLLQEEEHQNLVKQLQVLKDKLKEVTGQFSPDYMEHAIKSLGNKRVPKQTIGQLFGLEAEIRAFEAKLLSLSRQILTAQAQVALSATEVSSFSSSVGVKSERVDALGLLNYGPIAKRMVSEINDAQIYCDLLSIWVQDLTRFNHNLCYEVSNMEASVAEHYNWLRRLKNALCCSSPLSYK